MRNEKNKSNALIWVVAGPTASGKSDFAQSLGVEHGGEILNADSQQFYRGMDIGTGKISSDQQKVPHWMYDLCLPGELMSAIAFTRRADALIEEVSGRGKIPIIVGGTGLYLRALIEGFDELPSRDPQIREQLLKRLEIFGTEMLHRDLSQIDPQLAARVHPHDRSRLIRFLEINQITGKLPSQLLSRHPVQQTRYPVEVYWLRPDREFLHHRIRFRVREMLDRGWVEEVQSLISAGHDPRTLANKPIGYAELAEVIAGNLDLKIAEEKILFRTRQYAKRQETFFRGLFSASIYTTAPNRLRVLDASYYKAFSLTEEGR